LAQLVAYFRFENNGTHLFMLVDFISDTSQSGYDGFEAMFDTKDDGGNMPLPDDYQFHCENSKVSVSQGTGQGDYNPWSRSNPQPETKYASSFTHNNDPYDNQHDHETFELAIPLSFLAANKTMGFWVEVGDGKTSAYVSWPVHISKVPYKEGFLIVSPPLPYDWGDITIEAANGDTPNTNPTTTPTLPPSVTPTPDPNATATPTTTPTPYAPEVSWFVIVPLMLMFLSAAILVRHRKTAKA
jgi:hypothetical protein